MPCQRSSFFPPSPCYLQDAMLCQWSSRSFGGPASIKASVSRASCRSSKHSPGLTICLNHSNPQTLYFERFIYKAYDMIKACGEYLSVFILKVLLMYRNIKKLFFFCCINNGINNHK